MSKFKELLKKDLETTFYNKNEFAEEAIVEGQQIIIIIDDLKNKNPKSKKNFSTDYFYENHSETIKLVSMQKKDYILLGSPHEGRQISINDNSYEILEIDDNDHEVSLKVKMYG